MNQPHIYIVAAEKSGDELGAKLVSAIRKLENGDVKISGIGGSAMHRIGIISPIDISPLSILGFLEGLKSYPLILQLVNEAADAIISSKADACVLIDSWGFTMRVAKRLKKIGYKGKIIKYVAPQVWAMREGRSKILAEGVDHLLTIHAFDAPYFTRHGLPVTYVGNPVFDQEYDTGDGQGLRDSYCIPPNAPVLAMLFGSRLSEIQTLAQPFADAVRRLKIAMPELVIIAPVSDSISTDVMAAVAQHDALQDVILLNEDKKLDCFDLAFASISCSGTVTTQLACAGVPTIVAYRLNWLTYQIAKRLYKPDYISIVNIAAGDELMPECIQNLCTGENLARRALAYLQNEQTRQIASKNLLSAVKVMREGSGAITAGHTCDRAAIAIHKILH